MAVAIEAIASRSMRQAVGTTTPSAARKASASRGALTVTAATANRAPGRAPARRLGAPGWVVGQPSSPGEPARSARRRLVSFPGVVIVFRCPLAPWLLGQPRSDGARAQPHG